MYFSGKTVHRDASGRVLLHVVIIPDATTQDACARLSRTLVEATGHHNHFYDCARLPAGQDYLENTHSIPHLTMAFGWAAPNVASSFQIERNDFNLKASGCALLQNFPAFGFEDTETWSTALPYRHLAWLPVVKTRALMNARDTLVQNFARSDIEIISTPDTDAWDPHITLFASNAAPIDSGLHWKNISFGSSSFTGRLAVGLAGENGQFRGTNIHQLLRLTT